ncbi:hypothetical protein [Methylobacterium bullatum]|uniref:Uncharacterized protein n=1 Tax=Methylobacterium bullatum TaxID=570505 RepID=A0A679JP36_9HYPH|nr:hypothetical protein MBLL_00373 [Methylobacterium bullatum]
MFETKNHGTLRTKELRFLNLGLWNFLVALTALCIAGYTAWKQLRDVDDVTQVVYDIVSGSDYAEFLNIGSLSLAIYNSGTQPVVINRSYLYFVEHALARGKDNFGREIVEEHPVALCNQNAKPITRISMKDQDSSSGAIFRSLVVSKQDIKIIKLVFDLNYIYNYTLGFHSSISAAVIEPKEFEGAVCLFTSYSSLSVQRVDIHERLFVGKFTLTDYPKSPDDKNYPKARFIAAKPIQVYNHQQKVY